MALTEFSLRSLRSPSCHGTRCSTQHATFCFQRLAELRADVNAVSGAGVNAAYLVRTPAQVQAERGGKGREGAVSRVSCYRAPWFMMVQGFCVLR